MFGTVRFSPSQPTTILHTRPPARLRAQLITRHQAPNAMDKRKATFEDDSRRSKRSKSTPNSNKPRNDIAKLFRRDCERLLELLSKSQNEHKQALTTHFAKLPSKANAPDPLIADGRRNNMRIITSEAFSRGTYTSLAALRADIKLMIANAKRYNEEGSPVFNDAKIISSFIREKNKSKTWYDIALEILDDVVYDQDEHGRYYSELFMELPSKKDYPDYYKIVKKPVCFAQIENYLKKGLYSSLEEAEADLKLIVFNAETYNEAGSFVVQDAHALWNSYLVSKEKSPLGGGPSKTNLKVKLNLFQSPAASSQTPAPKLKITLRNKPSTPQVPVKSQTPEPSPIVNELPTPQFKSPPKAMIIPTRLATPAKDEEEEVVVPPPSPSKAVIRELLEPNWKWNLDRENPLITLCSLNSPKNLGIEPPFLLHIPASQTPSPSISHTLPSHHHMLSITPSLMLNLRNYILTVTGNGKKLAPMARGSKSTFEMKLGFGVNFLEVGVTAKDVENEDCVKERFRVFVVRRFG
ncbi:Chromatin structure-remodeling complex subunit rsc4 [Neolecta irregularis DAH-3]|uniref:Chromatin structure-remodeling complex subunit rsc4 n=1 Tax=Neolecta irregularis (strain DAH-3) TaxID=1198029 RepID=A0A1U7LSM3_NEOID|nr:Chromatin structure-remodeling complex subunit rsc4 [Neolecta irregularis DAH-3]|eukprot:OLL25676.1 Chromatin structure-remodeling complex subunit rsc4 [Neolecta irregularis DAH-3]